jgi:hypothetical protein
MAWRDGLKYIEVRAFAGVAWAKVLPIDRKRGD